MGMGEKRLKWERENDVFKVVSIIPRSVTVIPCQEIRDTEFSVFIRSLNFFFKKFLCFIAMAKMQDVPLIPGHKPSWHKFSGEGGGVIERSAGFITQRSRIPMTIPIGSASALGSRVSAT